MKKKCGSLSKSQSFDFSSLLIEEDHKQKKKGS